ASSIVAYFGANAAYVNVMANMSVDCDCCAKAADPEIGDIGILASLDPIALDQACLDLVYASEDPGKAALIERIESKNGALIVEAAAALGFGSREYELIELD
ncbi:MAG: ferredoxin, partial [Firmicutes bacterium]|nr:ferredoxin [Bacillota bacterium]